MPESSFSPNELTLNDRTISNHPTVHTMAGSCIINKYFDYLDLDLDLLAEPGKSYDHLSFGMQFPPSEPAGENPEAMADELPDELPDESITEGHSLSGVTGKQALVVRGENQDDSGDMWQQSEPASPWKLSVIDSEKDFNLNRLNAGEPSADFSGMFDWLSSPLEFMTFEELMCLVSRAALVNEEPSEWQRQKGMASPMGDSGDQSCPGNRIQVPVKRRRPETSTLLKAGKKTKTEKNRGGRKLTSRKIRGETPRVKISEFIIIEASKNNLIKWVREKEKGTFIIASSKVEHDEIARRWGEVNNKNMSYDSFSRAIRYKYESLMIKHLIMVDGVENIRSPYYKFDIHNEEVKGFLEKHKVRFKRLSLNHSK
ncbi:ETS domain-containing protein [Endozoicomonas sp.]|uniref:ETS domain-containing protein n=1 Tax=Endozoicomonas sp. TaxID=1892382 RepID=UPI003839EE7A